MKATSVSKIVRKMGIAKIIFAGIVLISVSVGLVSAMSALGTPINIWPRAAEPKASDCTCDSYSCWQSAVNGQDGCTYQCTPNWWVRQSCPGSSSAGGTSDVCKSCGGLNQGVCNSTEAKNAKCELNDGCYGNLVPNSNGSSCVEGAQGGTAGTTGDSSSSKGGDTSGSQCQYQGQTTCLLNKTTGKNVGPLCTCITVENGLAYHCPYNDSSGMCPTGTTGIHPTAFSGCGLEGDINKFLSCNNDGTACFCRYGNGLAGYYKDCTKIPDPVQCPPKTDSAATPKCLFGIKLFCKR